MTKEISRVATKWKLQAHDSPRFASAISQMKNGEILAHGGMDSNGDLFDDICLLKKSDTSPWKQVPHRSRDFPSARQGHTATNVFLPNQQNEKLDEKLIVFGGYGGMGRFHNEVWVLENPEEVTSAYPCEWTRLRLSGNPPTYAVWHSANFHAETNSLLVFGCAPDTFYSLDLMKNNWRTLRIRRNPHNPTADVEMCQKQFPTNRWRHTACIHSGSFFIFGGSTGYVTLGDFWRYCIGTNKWKAIFPTGAKPSPREKHCAIQIGRRWIIHGGVNNETYLADTYEIDLDSLHCSKIVLGNFPFSMSSQLRARSMFVSNEDVWDERPADEVACFEKASPPITFLFFGGKSSADLCSAHVQLHSPGKLVRKISIRLFKGFFPLVY
eukprot:GHVP01017815.1.p1 GENE.GHVP01017815.1~~GHVP01017815.1.p1  ORF type:complete len:382 (-),score=59.01 GHVP01017815.1:127-1272(-)